MAAGRGLTPLRAVVLGLLLSGAAHRLFGHSAPARPALWHVPEDASAPLARIAIHYAPAFDAVAMPVWRRLLGALPAAVEVEALVAQAADFDRLRAGLAQAGVRHDRMRAVVVGDAITTWSRDRFAAAQGPGGQGFLLAPPRVDTAFRGRAGDAASPVALSRALYGRAPRIAGVVFEGGDLVSTPRTLYVDVNLLARQRGRVAATREQIVAELRRSFQQEIVWLGDQIGELPAHHIMMYMVPLDERTVLVGDPRLGAELLARDPAGASLPVDPDFAGHVRRFDRAAQLLEQRGMRVVRVPVVVLEGAGSYLTYTNALFDRDAAGPVVYLPTYRVPALDQAARKVYESLGYRVVEIDVSEIYRLNGSLGCLVNVLSRGPLR